MSQETRTIRPFVNLGDIGVLVDDAVLLFGDAVCPPDSAIAFDGEPHTFLLRPVKIEWARDQAELDERISRVQRSTDTLRLRREQLSLMVVASTPYLRTAETVFEMSLADIGSLPRILSLTERSRSRAFDAPHHGFAVDVYVVLNQSISPSPLLPWRKGTWLARSRFEIATDAARTLFRLTPMGSSKKEQLGLGSKTLRYLDLNDHDPLEPFDDQPEAPTFFIDEQLLGQLNATSRTPAGRALQLQMAVDFVSAVVAAVARRPELQTKGLDDIEGSLLYRVIRAAAGAGARRSELEQLYMRIGNDPGWVISQAEHTIDVRGAFLNILEGGSQ